MTIIPTISMLAFAFMTLILMVRALHGASIVAGKTGAEMPGSFIRSESSGEGGRKLSTEIGGIFLLIVGVSLLLGLTDGIDGLIGVAIFWLTFLVLPHAVALIFRVFAGSEDGYRDAAEWCLTIGVYAAVISAHMADLI